MSRARSLIAFPVDFITVYFSTSIISRGCQVCARSLFTLACLFIPRGHRGDEKSGDGSLLMIHIDF